MNIVIHDVSVTKKNYLKFKEDTIYSHKEEKWKNNNFQIYH
jgi:hypothetical protein